MAPEMPTAQPGVGRPKPGAAAVAPSLSNLPGDWNPGGGKYIPRIAVYDTSPDKVPNVLAKFGMGQVDGGGNLQPGTNRFTLKM